MNEHISCISMVLKVCDFFCGAIASFPYWSVEILLLGIETKILAAVPTFPLTLHAIKHITISIMLVGDKLVRWLSDIRNHLC